MYRWLVLLHILAVFGFMMAHGVSISVAFTLRRERNPERLRSLLDLSGSSIGFLYLSILIFLVTGIVSGFMGHWWNRAWIWISLGLLIGILVYMYLAGSSFYGQVRKALGLGYMLGGKMQEPGEPANPEVVDGLLKQSRPVQLAVVGFGGMTLITLLMYFKPF
jgi:hypothetical protein